MRPCRNKNIYKHPLTTRLTLVERFFGVLWNAIYTRLPIGLMDDHAYIMLLGQSPTTQSVSPQHTTLKEDCNSPILLHPPLIPLLELRMLDIAPTMPPLLLIHLYARLHCHLQRRLPAVRVVVERLALPALLLDLPRVAEGVVALLLGEGFEGLLEGVPMWGRVEVLVWGEDRGEDGLVESLEPIKGRRAYHAGEPRVSGSVSSRYLIFFRAEGFTEGLDFPPVAEDVALVVFVSPNVKLPPSLLETVSLAPFSLFLISLFFFRR